MICPSCCIEKEEKDFLKKSTCYKCQYKEKVNVAKTLKRKICKHCKTDLPKHRWRYCSEECLQEEAKKYKKDYWTNKIKSQKIYRKNKIKI